VEQPSLCREPGHPVRTWDLALPLVLGWSHQTPGFVLRDSPGAHATAGAYRLWSGRPHGEDGLRMPSELRAMIDDPDTRQRGGILDIAKTEQSAALFVHRYLRCVPVTGGALTQHFVLVFRRPSQQGRRCRLATIAIGQDVEVSMRP
jgi:hypothetical protein